MRKQKPAASMWRKLRFLQVYQYWLLGGALLFAVVVVGQFFYPYEQALPGARVGDVDVGGLRYEEVIEKVRSRYQDVPLSLEIPYAGTVQTSTAKAGITPHYQDAARAVTEYTIEARAVPFSFLYKLFINRVSIGHGIEQERFAEFAADVQKDCRRSPRDARLAYRDGQVVLDPARPGQRCDTEQIRSAIQGVQLVTARPTVDIPVVAVSPARTDNDVRPHLSSARNIVTRGLTIAAPDGQWPVPSETLATWLVVEDGRDASRLALDVESVNTFLDGIRSELIIKPGTTVVTYRDGVEMGRDTGHPGRLVDSEVTIQRIEENLLGDSPSAIAWVQFSDVSPKQETVYTYSKTSQGVQTLLERWDREHGGRYGIIVSDMSGRGLNGAFNADMDFVTASTYKMFLAYATLHYAEQGDISLSQRTNTGLSVRACIDEMILHSTNECATALMEAVGWSKVHAFIRGQFPSTIMDNGASSDGEKHTTVRDETAFLQRLHAGTLRMSNDSHSYLLDLMKQQIYRDGIPAGVPGDTVANKVGFYAGYKHDVAIIYGSKGPYILAVLSYGGADWEFADLSRKVADLLQ